MAEDKKADAKKESAKKQEGDEAAPAAEAPAPKKGKMLWVVLGLVGLLVVAGVPTAYFLLKKSGPKTEDVATDAAQTETGPAIEGAGDTEELGEDEERLGAIFPLETFVVNLSGGKYLRTQMQLEFQGRDIPAKFPARLVLTRDSIITLLTKKSPEELESAKGKETLKSEVKDVVNLILKKEEVKHVYFTQFVIQ